MLEVLWDNELQFNANLFSKTMEFKFKEPVSYFFHDKTFIKFLKSFIKDNFCLQIYFFFSPLELRGDQWASKFFFTKTSGKLKRDFELRLENSHRNTRLGAKLL